jgi:hypothetical protein
MYLQPVFFHPCSRQGGKWFKFDDGDVTEVNIADDEELKNQCWGGEYMSEVRGECMSEVRGEYMSEVRGECMSEVRGEYMSEVRGEYMSEVRGEYMSEIRATGGEGSTYQR